jgi:apolipoprotein N-acyltransferase
LRAFVLPGVFAGGLALLAIGGTARLMAAPEVDPGAGGADGATVVRIVQPSIPQADKWKPELQAANWQRLVELTDRPGIEAVDVVVWPESAPPFVLSRTPSALARIGDLLPDGAYLVSGAVRFVENEAGGGGDPWTAFNALHVVDNRGRIRATYDKFHLVPFGEYLPFEAFLRPLGFEQLVQSAGDFAAGPGPRTLTLPGLGDVAPLICYEVIFPGNIVDPRARPDWIANVTDDAWFGTWAGPHQHFAQARMRAVEEGLPIVRAANNGISAVIDGYGRTHATLGLNEIAHLDVPLPESLAPTFYARIGDLAYLAIVILVAILIIAQRCENHHR